MNHRKTRRLTWRKVVTALAASVIPIGLLAAPPAEAVGPKAFPGAEGYGTDTPGGRGGTICQVTNLNDSGAGSFRACATASGPRVVIFRTGGTINLQSRINVLNPNMTVLGHTAPGDGITLRMAPGSNTDAGTMQIETHDIVIRYLRFRPGNPDGTADDSHDGVQIYKAGVNNVVIDHSSVSWAVDENVNTYDESDNITVSWSIISEALSNAGHPDGEHSKGMLSGGVNAHNVSIHHNLFASNVDRNPQISGVSVADVRNNVIYNYGDGSGNGTTLISSSKGHPQVNIVNNYYRKGASSPANYPDWALYSGDNGCVHQVHASGNKHDESGTVTNATRGSGCDSVANLASPHAAPAVTTTSAEQAYADVLASAGASKVRDAVDQRIVSEVQNRTGSFKDDAPSYPTLAPGTPPADSDGDGLPDSWESSGGGSDPNGDVDGDGYTNIEEWAESLIGGSTPPPPPPGNNPPSVNAGSDAAVTLPASANLDGTVSDPDAGDTVTTTWSKVSGPGTVTFGNASNVDTTASFSVDGTYVLRLSANDGTVTVTDDVQVTVSPENTPPPQNQTPIVSAGGDQTITLPDNDAALNGTSSDDGQLQPLSYAWAKVSGPGTVTFANAGAEDTTATFSAAGTYVLELEVDDGQYAVADTVTITVNPEETPPPPSGDVTFVGQSKAFSTTDSVSVPLPTGAQNGDTVVFYVMENKGYDAKIIPGQPLDVIPLNLQANDGSSLGARVFYHKVSATSPANFTFSGATVTQMGAHAVAYRNVKSLAIAGLDTDDNTDAAHPVDGTTLAPAVNLVLAGDRVFASGAVPSTWTLGTGLTERGEGQGPKSGSAFSTVVGDTVTPVAAGAKTYAATASASSPYAISALVELR